jgi:hypothetical protein
MKHAARAWVAENYEDRRVLGLMVGFYRQMIEPEGAHKVEPDGKLRQTVTGLPVLP